MSDMSTAFLLRLLSVLLPLVVPCESFVRLPSTRAAASAAASRSTAQPRCRRSWPTAMAMPSKDTLEARNPVLHDKIDAMVGSGVVVVFIKGGDHSSVLSRRTGTRNGRRGGVVVGHMAALWRVAAHRALTHSLHTPPPVRRRYQAVPSVRFLADGRQHTQQPATALRGV